MPTLDHRARHQCRGMARRHRVGLGQPDMCRHDAGLRAEPDERQQESERAKLGMSGKRGGIGIEIGTARELAEHDEKDKQEGRAQMRRRQIGPGGVPHCRLAVVENDEEEWRQRHDLPGQQEQQPVMRGDNGRHAGSQQIQVKPAGSGLAWLAPARHVGAAVNRGQDRQPEHRKQEKSRKGVDLKVDRAARHERRGRQIFRIPRHQHADRSGQPDGATGNRPCLSCQSARPGTRMEHNRRRAAQNEQQNGR